MQKFTKKGKKGQKRAKNADFSRTDKSTAKPMFVGCVQHYSTHFIKKIGKSLEPFFHKVQKTAKKAKKGPKRGKKGDFSYFTKKRATLRSSPYRCLTSCQVSEKSLERFLRKAVTDARTHGRTDKTDSIGPSGFQPGTNKE